MMRYTTPIGSHRNESVLYSMVVGMYLFSGAPNNQCGKQKSDKVAQEIESHPLSAGQLGRQQVYHKMGAFTVT